jgi:hypothetical protein
MRAPFVGNDSFSFGFDGHRWAVWHEGHATNIKPFEETKHVRVVSAEAGSKDSKKDKKGKKNKKGKKTKKDKLGDTAQPTTMDILLFDKPDIMSGGRVLQLDVGHMLDVEREVHTKEGDWVLVAVGTSQVTPDLATGSLEFGWLRLPNTAKLSKKLVKKAGIQSKFGLEDWATLETLERVTAEETGQAMRWKAGDVIGCRLQISDSKASMSWDWNGKRLPHIETMMLPKGQSLRPVMSCIAGPPNRPVFSVSINPRDMRYPLPEGYDSLVCSVSRPSRTKHLMVIDAKRPKGATFDVDVPETAQPGTQVEIKLPSGHLALATVPTSRQRPPPRSFKVKMPGAASPDDGGVLDVTVEEGWEPGSTQQVETLQSITTVAVPLGSKTGDKFRWPLPPKSSAQVTVQAYPEPMLKGKANKLEYTVGTQLRVLAEMTTAEGDWLQIVEDADNKGSSGDQTAGASTTDEVDEPSGPLGWVLMHCDKGEHAETHVKRVVPLENELVVCSTSLLNIRAAASKTSQIQRKVYPGSVLEMVETGDGATVRGDDDAIWTQVRYKEQLGWVQVMHPHPVEDAQPQSSGLFHKKAQDVNSLAGVNMWNCLPQTVAVIERFERAAPAQLMEVPIDRVNVLPGSLTAVQMPLTGESVDVVVPPRETWKKGPNDTFTFTTRVVVSATDAEPDTPTEFASDASSEDLRQDLEKTLHVIDKTDECTIEAAENGTGITARAVGGPATVRGKVRGGRGRWYFEVRVSSSQGYVGICSSHFQDRKKGRSLRKFDQLKDSLSDTMALADIRKTDKKPKDKDELMDKQAKVQDDADTKVSVWTTTETAFVYPKVDASFTTRGGDSISEADRATLWSPGEIFRALVDHQVYHCLIPPGYLGGLIGFEVHQRYCALGEDLSSLNVGYTGSSKLQNKECHPGAGLSSGFLTRLPDVEFEKYTEDSDAENNTDSGGNDTEQYTSKHPVAAVLNVVLWLVAIWDTPASALPALAALMLGYLFRNSRIYTHSSVRLAVFVFGVCVAAGIGFFVASGTYDLSSNTILAFATWAVFAVLTLFHAAIYPQMKASQVEDQQRRQSSKKTPIRVKSERKNSPVALSKRTGNEAPGLLAELRGWQPGDIVGVCIDTAELTVHYTLNG